MIWENKYLVFNVTDGPKIMMETLDTWGKDGWEIATIIAIAGGEQLVAFLKKEVNLEAPDPEEGKKEKLKKLWGSDDE